MFGRLGVLGSIGSLGAKGGGVSDDTAVDVSARASLAGLSNTTALTGFGSVAAVSIETDPAAEFGAVSAVTVSPALAGYVAAPAISNIFAATATPQAGYTATVGVSNIAATTIERSVGYSWTNSEGETFEAAMSGSYSDAKLGVIDTLITDLKVGLTHSTNTYGALDFLALHFLDNATDALRWLNSPSTLMTAVNSPTHTAGESYGGDGSTSYIDTGLDPSSATQMSQNSVSLSVWVHTVGGSATQMYAGSENTFQGELRINRSTDGTAWFALANNGGVSGTTLSQNATGMLSANRTGSSAVQAYRGGVSENTGTGSSAALPARNIYLLARNGRGTAGFHTTGKLSASAAGRGLTANEQVDLNAAVNKAITAWAAA